MSNYINDMLLESLYEEALEEALSIEKDIDKAELLAEEMAVEKFEHLSDSGWLENEENSLWDGYEEYLEGVTDTNRKDQFYEM